MPDISRFQWSSRKMTASTKHDSLNIEVGPGGEWTETGWVAIQFDPTIDFVGSFRVLGRMVGQVPETELAPFVPVAYRIVSLGGVALPRTLVIDDITQSALIEVPANGLTISLLTAIQTGTCDLFKVNGSGPSTG